MVWRVLPTFARTAATKSHRLTPGETLSPCSQSHARLAEHIAAPAGGPLPHPFTPYLSRPESPGGTALCCGCSQTPVTRRPPPLTVSWGALSSQQCDQMGVGKFLYRHVDRQRRLLSTTIQSSIETSVSQIPQENRKHFRLTAPRFSSVGLQPASALSLPNQPAFYGFPGVETSNCGWRGPSTQI